MDAFDKVIGYAAIKQRLKRTADALSNPEAYKEMGVQPPRGMLLYGEPGVGKTLMARCLIEQSGREAITCRKDEPHGEFVRVIRKKFEEAIEKAPSVLLLDDLDKFANEDEGHRDAEEYVTVQSCLDELAQSGGEVFVLATANDIRCLPDSLMRSGRLGNKIKISGPTGADAETILSHYLSGKKVVDSINPAFLARAMGGRSCAALEEVVNEAGLLAASERSGTITNGHLTKAILHSIFDVPETALEGGGSNVETATMERTHAAYHEAGHAVVAEVLASGSVTLASLHGTESGKTGGFVLSHLPDEISALRAMQIDIIVSLGSKASLEQKFGVMDRGIEEDLFQAFSKVGSLVRETCCCGFNMCSTRRIIDSEDLKSRIEQATAAEVERYYRKAKEILSVNAGFLDALATALLERNFLSMYDIAEIKETCNIVQVSL